MDKVAEEPRRMRACVSKGEAMGELATGDQGSPSQFGDCICECDHESEESVTELKSGYGLDSCMPPSDSRWRVWDPGPLLSSSRV